MKAATKIHVAVIEPSPVVRQGIKSVLEGNSTLLSIAEMHADLQTFQENAANTAAFNIILVNPSVISMYRPFHARNLFPDCPDTAIVAILYGYTAVETLGSFDGTLDIYDSGTAITKKLERLAGSFDAQQSGNGSENIALSDREKEILVAVARGMTNKEIADRHCISIHTVISHRKNITRKTGIKTISGLTIYAIFNGLVQHEELSL